MNPFKTDKIFDGGAEPASGNQTAAMRAFQNQEVPRQNNRQLAPSLV
jgi:hypothetical protein